MKQEESLRIYLILPVIHRQFECVFPSGRSLNDCIPYLRELLNEEFEHRYTLDENTIFLEAETGIQISRTVTLSRQNLQDGMRLYVY